MRYTVVDYIIGTDIPAAFCNDNDENAQVCLKRTSPGWRSCTKQHHYARFVCHLYLTPELKV